MLFELLVFALLAGAVIACLSWSDISSWISSNKDSSSLYCEIIKKELSDGNYGVSIGIFNRHGTKTNSKDWTAKELDEEMKRRFKGSNRIRVEI